MSDSACPSRDWIRIGDYCYLGDDRYMSFEKAVDFCEKNDAGLATVRSKFFKTVLKIFTQISFRCFLVEKKN